ncbi:carbonic anhydrase 2-like [Drosophila innubila]|uniref:carbonic anhydrase 2-like n=1 Tax=Drosophila innubila TaxID=198719 RepID=UPI00148BAC56|nr:carbonic anhydrase 2-like [Drosophila innubila]
MKILNRHGVGLEVQFLLLSAISFISSRADLQLSDEYLSEIRADVAVDKAAGEYNYDQQGADWPGTCNEGKKQSPIDLIKRDAIVKSIPEIRFNNYDKSLQTPLLVVNNGHTANMVLPANSGGNRASISGGMLPGVFEAQSVHFHWGSPNTAGSEHAIDFERYDVETHIVHKNTKYSNLTVGEASEYWDGLAVLGAMLRASRGSPLQRSGLHRIFNVLPEIIPYEANATITGQLTVRELLGNISPAEFFTYNGSLTTPNCAESVTWTVFKDVASFPQGQISKLWNLRDSRRRELINNYRELQDLNNRPVYFRQRRQTILF